MRAEYDFSKGRRRALIPQRGKTQISIHIDNIVLEAFRSLAEKKGIGYQTKMNEALREYLSSSLPQPVTKEEVREVLREEMPRVPRSLETRPRRPRASKRTQQV
jgi:hypothetical protein